MKQGKQHTFTTPEGDFLLELSAELNVCFPTRLLSTVQDRTHISSACAVKTSSQSLDRVDEQEMEVMGGNFNEARGFDRVVAFRARDPREIQISDRRYHPALDTYLVTFRMISSLEQQKHTVGYGLLTQTTIVYHLHHKTE
jgi:hypothetical protein